MFRDVTGTRRVTVPFRQIRENEVSKWQRVRQCAYLGHARALRDARDKRAARPSARALLQSNMRDAARL